MTKHSKKKGLNDNDAVRQLDIFSNVSHNKALSNQRLIELVKLMARKAAERDYAQINSSFKI